MILSRKRVSLASLCSVFLLSIMIIFRSVSLFAADNNSIPSGQGLECKIVRVLPNFKQKSFGASRMGKEMYRSSYLLTQSIYKHLTNEAMPAPPFPPIKLVPKKDGDQPPMISPPVSPPTYHLFPVAWSLKTVNLNNAFLPQLREEVIVVEKFVPQYFKKDAFPDGTWVLACLRNTSRRYHEDYPKKRNPTYDTVSLWKVAFSPELVNPEKPPESSILRYRPNIMCFKDRPTLEQIADFVKSTDFGKNDIYAHISHASCAKYSVAMEVEVMQVVVYPKYSKCLKLFQEGLTPEIISRRKAAYEEKLRRSTIFPHIRSPNP